MKHIVSMALMFTLGIAAVYAHEQPVKMTFSGTAVPSTVDLQQPNTSVGEENVAGKGTLGAFTFRQVSTHTAPPQSSSTCSGPYFPRTKGAGVFRFQDGSLLTVNLVEGGDCVDLAHPGVGNCTLTLTITGGTRRFQNATGTLTFTETGVTVLNGDDPNNPVLFFTETGEITGTISGVARAEERPDEQQ